MLVFERRATTILYNLIKMRGDNGHYLLPANVCPIVPLTIKKAGCTFEMIDISHESLCADHGDVLNRVRDLKNSVAGVVYVRTYGACADAHELFAQVKAYSPQALVIDDRCLCEPSFGDIEDPNVDAIIYSTGYAKYVDIGFGGFAALRDSLPYRSLYLPFAQDDFVLMMERCNSAIEKREKYSYRDSNWLDTEAPLESWESYCDTVDLTKHHMVIKKKQINSIYSSILPLEIQLPQKYQSWRFNIQVRDKEKVLNAIRDSGFFASSHYASLAGIFDQGKALNSEVLHLHVINLFNDKYITPEQAERLSLLIAKCPGLAAGPLEL